MTYVLTETGEAMPEPDARAWAAWFEKSYVERNVAREAVGTWVVSTVFLGLDHGRGNGLPVLWETMVFPAAAGEVSDWGEVYGERYTSQAEAVAGHARVVAHLRDGLPIETLREGR